MQWAILGLLLLTHQALACPDDPLCSWCRSTDGSSRCLSCNFSYLDAATGRCSQKDMSIISNCESYSRTSVSIECRSCISGYTNMQSECVRCETEGCAICPLVQECRGCFNGRRLNKEKNICEQQIGCEIPNCDICHEYEGNQACFLCKPGYAFESYNNLTCVKSQIPNCLMHQINNINGCEKCLTEYFVSSDGKCKPSNQRLNSMTIFVVVLVLIGIIGVTYIVQTQKRNLRDKTFEELVQYSVI